MNFSETMNPIKRLGYVEIANILRRKIVNGQILPSERLPPGRQLSETYGVARGTIREALNLLSAEELIEIKQGSGAYVISAKPIQNTTIIQEASPLELIDALFALEPHICRLASLNAKSEDFRKADKLIVSMEKNLHDPNFFSNADSEFHMLLSETTGNELLIWMVAEINNVRNHKQWSRMRKITLNPKTMANYTEQHKKILNAIKARTPETAAMLMKEHLEDARSSLTASTLF